MLGKQGRGRREPPRSGTTPRSDARARGPRRPARFLLLGYATSDELLAHPIVGASWEGLAVEHISRWGLPVHYWRTQAGAEIDIVLDTGARPWGIEIKRTDAPRVTPSMLHALDDLGLERILVAHGGPDRFPMAERIEAVPARELLTWRTLSDAL